MTVNVSAFCLALHRQNADDFYTALAMSARVLSSVDDCGKGKSQIAFAVVLYMFKDSRSAPPCLLALIDGIENWYYIAGKVAQT